MSHHEQFAQVAHQKWENEQITRIFEQMSDSLSFFATNKWFTQKTDEWISNPAIFANLA